MAFLMMVMPNNLVLKRKVKEKDLYPFDKTKKCDADKLL